MKVYNLVDFYQHLDDVVSNDAQADELFTSSYIRGFVSLSASQFGDDNQYFSAQLVENVNAQLEQARTELTSQDYQLVQNYWQVLVEKFCH